MSEPKSVFTKKYAETLAQDQKAILEEMNLPPALVTWIRANAQAIKIGIAVLVILVVGWEAYGNYTARRDGKASTMLYHAIKAATPEERTTLLGEVIDKYGRTDAGVWARVELGHIAFKTGDHAQAIERYTAARKAISASAPLYPLVVASLAQAYENNGDTANATASYESLLKIKGFEAEAYLGLGRLSEAKGDLAKAMEQYENYVNLPGAQGGATRNWVQNKIARLKQK